MGGIIRPAERSDAPAVREIYAPFIDGSATSFETTVPAVPDVARRIRDVGGQYPWLVFEAHRRVLGYAYACRHRDRQAYQWSVESSVYVHAEARNRGVGRALYAALFEILRGQGYVNVYAGITLPNPASVRLHESAGFTSVGVFSRIGFKFGRWHDVAWYQLRLQEAPTPLPDPLPSLAVLQEARTRAFLRETTRSIRLDRVTGRRSDRLDVRT